MIRSARAPCPNICSRSVLGLAVGETTPPFGSMQDGVRVLMLCGRDDPTADNGPNFDQMMGQMEDERIAKRAQRYLRDLRNDAYIEYTPREGRLAHAVMPARPLAVSLGDPAGIGPELIARSLGSGAVNWACRLSQWAAVQASGRRRQVARSDRSPIRQIATMAEAAAVFAECAAGSR